MGTEHLVLLKPASDKQMSAAYLNSSLLANVVLLMFLESHGILSWALLRFNKLQFSELGLTRHTVMSLD